MLHQRKNHDSRTDDAMTQATAKPNAQQQSES